MEQFINTNQEDNNTVTQESLEWRANQIYEYILNNCGDLHLANFHQHLDELSWKIFLSDEEKKAVLPYILNKITQKIITDYSQRSIVLDFWSIADPKQFLMIALNQLFIEMILDQKKWSTFDYLPLNEAAAWWVQVGYISIIKHLLLLGQSNNERTFIKQHDVQSQFFWFALELYPLWSYHRSPGYWIDMFQKLQGNQREFLKSVPFVWWEKDFRSYVQSWINQSHVRINGKQYKINGKAKDRWKKVEKNQKKMEKQGWKRQMIIEDKAITKAITLDTSDKPQWCVYMTMHDEGPSIEYVPTYNNKLFAFEMKFNWWIRSEISLNRTITHKIDEEECDKNMSNIFQDILIPYGQFFDEQIFVTSLDNLREFDIQNSTQKTPTTSVVESVAQDATTLVSTAFVDPKTHHVDVARSLWLDVINHSEDIGTFEAVSHIKYANSHGNSSLHYIPKIAWLIDILEDIIPKNKHGKITAHTLPSSPYIFIYTDKGTIFISDIDNVGTQVFAQKVDPEYINHDFSFPKLGQLFWPYTSIKNNFGEIISDESADIWAKNITDALAKKDWYFLDLMNDKQNHWLANFRKMYESWSITKADFATQRFWNNFSKITIANYSCEVISQHRKNRFSLSRTHVEVYHPLK